MKRNATTQESGSEDGCTRRRSRITALLASFLAVACATETPPERTGETGPAARPNYTIRLDSESSDPAQFQLVEDDDGIRVQTGPAGIAYRAVRPIPPGSSGPSARRGRRLRPAPPAFDSSAAPRSLNWKAGSTSRPTPPRFG